MHPTEPPALLGSQQGQGCPRDQAGPEWQSPRSPGPCSPPGLLEPAQGCPQEAHDQRGPGSHCRRHRAGGLEGMAQ
eukprot:1448538-Lingulodinium_polyedra.AAC.1